MKFPIYFLTAAVALGSLIACSSSPQPVVNTTPVTTVAKPAQDSLLTPKARYSYALGMDMGRALKNVDADLDKEILLRSVRDQMEGNKVLMTEAEAEKALQELLVEMQAQKEKKAVAASEKAIADQNAFLAKNKTEAGVITTASGLQYKILTPGTGITPKGSDKVSVHYTGSLLDGTEFDSSIKRGEPLEFPMDAVIQGWQEMLSLMKEGMKVKAWIPSSLGYGTEGAAPVIPANALLVFEVELLKVMPEPGIVDTTAKATAVKPAASAKADTTKKVAPAAAKADTTKATTAKATAVKPAVAPAKADTTKKVTPAAAKADTTKATTAKATAVKPAVAPAKADTTKKVAPAAKANTTKATAVKPAVAPAKADTTKKVAPAAAKADTAKATTVKK